MNKKTIISVLICTATIAFSIFVWLSQPKMAYYNYNEVYNNCTLKKKLEEDLKKVGSVRSSELDSLQLELSFISEKIKANTANDYEKASFESLQNRFLTFQEKYQNENLQLKENYFNQIREYINQKSKEFAEKKGYDYFFAATGDGSLMFAAESENVTEDFLLFAE